MRSIRIVVLLVGLSGIPPGEGATAAWFGSPIGVAVPDYAILSSGRLAGGLTGTFSRSVSPSSARSNLGGRSPGGGTSSSVSTPARSLRPPASQAAPASHRALSTGEMASKLRTEIDRNSVIVPHGSGRRSIQYDLAGRGHFEKSTQKLVPTPHKQSTVRHDGPTGSSVTKSVVEPMTKQDVRIVRRVVGDRNSGRSDGNGK